MVNDFFSGMFIMGWKKPVGTILLWMDISNSGSLSL
jgi:hypothetical protein